MQFPQQDDKDVRDAHARHAWAKINYTAPTELFASAYSLLRLKPGMRQVFRNKRAILGAGRRIEPPRADATGRFEVKHGLLARLSIPGHCPRL